MANLISSIGIKISKATVIEFIRYLKESCLIFPIENYAAKFAERNSNLTKWEHEINLHVAQDIFYLKERGSKIQVTFDVINFANMLNKKWGANYYLPYNLTPVTVSGSTNADGILVPEYTFKDQSNVLTKNDISSRWHCQVGVRLTF